MKIQRLAPVLALSGTLFGPMAHAQKTDGSSASDNAKCLQLLEQTVASATKVLNWEHDHMTDDAKSMQGPLSETDRDIISGTDRHASKPQTEPLSQAFQVIWAASLVIQQKEIADKCRSNTREQTKILEMMNSIISAKPEDVEGLMDQFSRKYNLGDVHAAPK